MNPNTIPAIEALQDHSFGSSAQLLQHLYLSSTKMHLSRRKASHRAFWGVTCSHRDLSRSLSHRIHTTSTGSCFRGLSSIFWINVCKRSIPRSCASSVRWMTNCLNSGTGRRIGTAVRHLRGILTM